MAQSCMVVWNATTAGRSAQRWGVPESLATEDQLGVDVIEPFHRAVPLRFAGPDEVDFHAEGQREPQKEPDAMGGIDPSAGR